MKLSIIIPVYNEKDTILKILGKIDKVRLNKFRKEIIIVDDFSTDGTREKLKKLKKKNLKLVLQDRNYGKGFAIRTGFENATGDIVLIQDADEEYNPQDYHKLLKPILSGETNIVYGSRFLKKNPDYKINLFYLGNNLLSLATSIIYFRRITDMETCYKVFRKEVLKDIKLHSMRFEIEPEMTAKFLRKGNKILEVPISYNPRSSSEGKKIRFRDGVFAIWTLVKYRFIKI